MTPIDLLVERLAENGILHSSDIAEANELFKQHKIDFACQVAEVSASKYIQGKTTLQIAEELLTFKSE